MYNIHRVLSQARPVSLIPELTRGVEEVELLAKWRHLLRLMWRPLTLFAAFDDKGLSYEAAGIFSEHVTGQWPCQSRSRGFLTTLDNI